MSTAHAVSEALTFLAEIQITPTSPPEMGKFVNLVNYLAWFVSLAGIAAVIYGGGKFGWERFHGGAVESPKIIMAALVGGIIATSAGPIMNNVVSASG
ncbi:hypothetical protein ACIA8C_10025 [Nocardia sp. NPDC051321]|uniref:hypothetical protein n=1 Tax=Nocardia sp. NPDC051321 TaxID=3364323 RepID=UPI00379E2C22